VTSAKKDGSKKVKPNKLSNFITRLRTGITNTHIYKDTGTGYIKKQKTSSTHLSPNLTNDSH
jgi:uncharacterized protein (DUF1786 family)